MKSAAILMTVMLLAAGSAMAQSNATVKGTETTNSNSAGTPNAATPTGQLNTTTVTGSGATSQQTPAPAYTK